MLGILLTILKITGIILLTILLLVLGILLILLLVPVRYHMAGEYGEEKWCRGKVTWLLHLVSIPISVDENGVDVKVKIFGRALKKSGDKKKKRKKKNNKKKKKAGKKSSAAKKNAKAEAAEEKTVVRETSEETAREKTVVQEPSEETVEEKTVVPESAADIPAQETGIAGIISRIHGKIEDVIRKIKKIFRKITELFSKAEELNEKREKILDFFCEQEAFEAKNQTVEIIKKLLKHILPYKIDGKIHFGMEYPDATGQAYAVMTLFYDRYADSLELEPDFEQKVLEGKIEFWGRIRLVNLIYYAICLYKIGKLREFISLIRSL